MRNNKMDFTSKDTIIEVLEIAECNLLNSLKGLQPGDIYKQILPEINHIAWIFGHCAVHLHWTIDLSYKEQRTYSEEVCHYYRYGTSKEEILNNPLPIGFRNIVDSYLEISRSSFEYLRSLDEDAIYKDFTGYPKETLLQALYRVALHYMGHMGQIVLIRRALGNPGSSFVDGATKQSRNHILKEWNDWWKTCRDDYND